MIIERHARRDDVYQGKSFVRDTRLQDGHQLLLVAGERPGHKGGTQRKCQQHRIDGGLFVGLALLGRRSHVGGRGKLSLGESVHAVVLQHVQHVHAAADGVRQLAQPDGQGVAVSGNADVGERTIGRRRAGGDRWHATVHGVESVRLLHEIRGGFRRAANATHLGDPMRLEIEFPCGLYQCRRNRIVTAPGAQGGHRPLVVPEHKPQSIGARTRVANGRFRD